MFNVKIGTKMKMTVQQCGEMYSVFFGFHHWNKPRMIINGLQLYFHQMKTSDAMLRRKVIFSYNLPCLYINFYSSKKQFFFSFMNFLRIMMASLCVTVVPHFI